MELNLLCTMKGIYEVYHLQNFNVGMNFNHNVTLFKSFTMYEVLNIKTKKSLEYENDRVYS